MCCCMMMMISMKMMIETAIWKFCTGLKMLVLVCLINERESCGERDASPTGLAVRPVRSMRETMLEVSISELGSISELALDRALFRCSGKQTSNSKSNGMHI